MRRPMSGMAASEAVQAGGLELPPLIVTRSAAEVSLAVPMP